MLAILLTLCDLWQMEMLIDLHHKKEVAIELNIVYSFLMQIKSVLESEVMTIVKWRHFVQHVLRMK